MASTSEELSSQSEQLRGMMKFFTLDAALDAEPTLVLSHKDVEEEGRPSAGRQGVIALNKEKHRDNVGVSINVQSGYADRLDRQFERF